MIKLISIAIILLSVIDLFASYAYFSTFNKKFPQLDYTNLEANPIIRMSMKTFGLNKGMLIGGIIVFAIVVILALAISDNWAHFLSGMLLMMCIYHLLNFTQLAALKPVGGP